jgi:FlaG/FlaF family flagellin (archaellin)
MFYLIKNNKGVSPIIATLMLTIIAVGAATSFAFFIEQQTEEYQKAQTAKQNRELENLEIVSITNLNYNESYLENLSFMISNLNIKKSTISRININSYILMEFNLTSTTIEQETWYMNKRSGQYNLKNVYYANDTDERPYIFQDLNFNMKYDLSDDILVRYSGLDDNLAQPNLNNNVWKCKLDSNGEQYIFNDYNKNGTWDASPSLPDLPEPIIKDIDKNKVDANPGVGDRNSTYPYGVLEIKPQEQLEIIIDKINESENYANVTNRLEPKNNDEDIPRDTSLTLSILTSQTNIFERTFIPPTSIIRIITETEWNNITSSYEDFLILDGSLSDHPTENGYIKKWNWEIDGPTFNTTLSGRKIRAPDELTNGDTYNVILEVIDNFGMIGSSQVIHP